MALDPKKKYCGAVWTDPKAQCYFTSWDNECRLYAEDSHMRSPATCQYVFSPVVIPTDKTPVTPDMGESNG